MQPKPDLLSTEELTANYNSEMTAILDQVAPLKLKKSKVIPSKSWFNTELNKERSQLRMAERQWRQHSSTEQLHLLRQERASYNIHIVGKWTLVQLHPPHTFCSKRCCL